MPPKDLILAFDTSAAHCAVALLSGDRVLAEIVEPMTKGQAERLFPIIEDVLKSQGVDWADITRIGVGIGPGNFTGIRISVASARGLALSLGIPAIGVSAFDALAFELPRPVLASVDARADRIYTQVISDDVSTEPTLSTLPEFASSDRQSCESCVGHLSGKLAAITKAVPAEPKYSTAVAIAKIATTATPHTRPAPLYVRPADAAPARDVAPTIIP